MKKMLYLAINRGSYLWLLLLCCIITFEVMPSEIEPKIPSDEDNKVKEEVIPSDRQTRITEIEPKILSDKDNEDEDNEFDNNSIGMSSQHEAIQNVMTNLGVNKRTAIAFLQYVDDFVTEVQDNFTKIASHQTPRSQKEHLIEETLDRYFEEPMESEVQVSSLNRKKVKSYPVQVYLNRLSKLDLKYRTVKLHFDKNYFSMAPIRTYNDRDCGSSGIGDIRYEFKLDMWQLFHGGCYDDYRRCYVHFTQKAFHIAFVPYSDGWKIKIFAITVDQPVRAYEGDDWKERLRNKFQ